MCPKVPVCLRVSVCLSGCINYESEDCVPNVKLTLAGSGLLMDLCCKTEAVPHTHRHRRSENPGYGELKYILLTLIILHMQTAGGGGENLRKKDFNKKMTNCCLIFVSLFLTHLQIISPASFVFVLALFSYIHP